LRRLVESLEHNLDKVDTIIAKDLLPQNKELMEDLNIFPIRRIE